MKKKILFTGGGTGGHVTKNLILLEMIKKDHSEIECHYAGLKTGPEYKLIKKGVPLSEPQRGEAVERLAIFHPITSGKLRRYFSLQTIPDFFRFLIGIYQSYRLIHRLKPTVVFSSGGYVALPVAIATWLYQKRTQLLSVLPFFRSSILPFLVTHETDTYPGLANRIISRFADTTLLGYESATKHFKGSHTIYTGNPVKPELLKPQHPLSKTPTLFITGGSQGAKFINDLIEENLPTLVRHCKVIHLTGMGKPIDFTHSNYRQHEYVTSKYIPFLQSASIIITRGGGNTLSEIAAVSSVQQPPAVIIIPHPATGGNHQYYNAKEMQKIFPEWVILQEKDLDAKKLLKTIQNLKRPKQVSQKNQASKKILEVIVRQLLYSS